MKKTVSLLLAISMVFALVSCGGEAVPEESAQQVEAEEKIPDIPLFPFKEVAQYGYMDIEGNRIIEPQFNFARPFCDDMACVAVAGKWGAINKAGEMVIATQYEDMGDFNEGYNSIKINGKWGLVDKKGNVVIEPKYEELSAPSEGLICAKTNGKCGYMDLNENWVIEPKFHSGYNFSYGIAAAQLKEDDKWGFIDKSGNWKIEPQYKYVSAFREGWARVADDNDHLFIDTEGKVVLDPDCKILIGFSEGWSPAYVHAGIGVNKYGYIDKNGNWVIEPSFDGCSTFNDGLAIVGLNGEEFYIDKTGKRVDPKK